MSAGWLDRSEAADDRYAGCREVAPALSPQTWPLRRF